VDATTSSASASPGRTSHHARLPPGPLRRSGHGAGQRRRALDLRARTLWRQKLAFIASPFADVGRPFAVGDFTLRRWRASYGGALRISWNLATIVTIDYGMSSEDAGLYINFGHIF
jgi:hypothetical protein